MTNVLQQALEALEPFAVYGRHGSRDVEVGAAITAVQALRSALAQQGEPVIVATEYTTGHCENNKRKGGCQLHNLQCGWPNCDRKPIAAAPVAQPACQPQWQPIETAPKDGTLILVLGNNYNDAARGQHHCIASWIRNGFREVPVEDNEPALEFLTHWIPLPPAPGATAPAAQGCDYCNNPLFAGRKCKNCGREFAGATPAAQPDARKVIEQMVDALEDVNGENQLGWWVRGKAIAAGQQWLEVNK